MRATRCYVPSNDGHNRSIGDYHLEAGRKLGGGRRPTQSSSFSPSSVLSSSDSLASESSSSASSSSSSGISTSVSGASGSTPSSLDINRYTRLTSAVGSAMSYPDSMSAVWKRTKA